jgi:hypothetical protein
MIAFQASRAVIWRQNSRGSGSNAVFGFGVTDAGRARYSAPVSTAAGLSRVASARLAGIGGVMSSIIDTIGVLASGIAPPRL